MPPAISIRQFVRILVLSDNKRRNRHGAPLHASASQARQAQARSAVGNMPRSGGRRRKVLSQNLLRDPRAIQTFLDSVGSLAHPAVEGGAGDGILTVGIAALVPRLTAVEVDPSMARRLRERTKALDNVHVVETDLLAMPAPPEEFVLLGNIPFAITTKIVAWALAAPTLRSATLLTQREYARKRTGDYGRWTLATMRTWPWWEWRLGPTIGRDSFRPRPAVDAAVLHLERRQQPLLPRAAEQAWVRAVETGFSGVGGSLRASLGRIYPSRRVDAACDSAGVGRDELVAFVTPDQWVAVFNDLLR